MEKSRKEIQVPFGDLIVALYDETEKLTHNSRLQTLLVALALLDLRKRAVLKTRTKVLKSMMSAA